MNQEERDITCCLVVDMYRSLLKAEGVEICRTWLFDDSVTAAGSVLLVQFRAMSVDIVVADAAVVVVALVALVAVAVVAAVVVEVMGVGARVIVVVSGVAAHVLVVQLISTIGVVIVCHCDDYSTTVQVSFHCWTAFCERTVAHFE